MRYITAQAPCTKTRDGGVLHLILPTNHGVKCFIKECEIIEHQQKCEQGSKGSDKEKKARAREGDAEARAAVTGARAKKRERYAERLAEQCRQDPDRWACPRCLSVP